MQMKGKLALLIPALRLLTNQLTARKAKFRSSSMLTAKSSFWSQVRGYEQATILAALSQLQAVGSTAGEAGLKLADAIAERAG